MLVAFLQIFPAAAACAALWWLWRSVEEEDRLMAAAGFLLRAFVGVAAFWVSWLRLPIARSLQLGEGFWFFGFDGTAYYILADRMLSGGLIDVVFFDRTIRASQYVQLIAFGRMMAGVSIAVALLINLLFYLATMSVVSRWRGSEDGWGRRLALATLSFLPTWVLWSLQPLKEAFFLFLVVLFVDGLRRWARHWNDTADYRSLSIGVVEMFVALFLIGGVRWYFTFIIWYALLAASLIAALVRRRDRVRELASSLALFFILSQTLFLTMPKGYGFAWRKLFELVLWLQRSRESFAAVDAATKIIPGPVLADLPLADLLARSVACFVPRFIAQPLGLVTIGGGRGLWVIAEMDTIVFLLVLVLSCVGLRRLGSRMFGQTVVMAMAGAFCGALSMLWVVDNFGTLLRLREMLLLPLVLAVAAVLREREAAEVPHTESAAGVTSRGIQE